MTVLKDLVRNVVVIILLTTFLEMLLPSGSMKRFIKVVTGIFVLMAVLSPLSDLIRAEQELAIFDWYQPEVAAGYSSVLEDGNRLSGLNQELLRDNYAFGLEKQIVALVKLVRGVESAQAKVTLKQGDNQGSLEIESVQVLVGRSKKAEENQFSIVEPIKIQVSLQGEKGYSQSSEAEGTEDAQDKRQALEESEKSIAREIKNTIAQYYGLRLEQITVTFS